MFQRLIYKIHLTEIFDIKRFKFPREVLNLGLALFLIFFGSFYFAFQGITNAQSSSNTAASTTKSSWQNPQLVGTNHLPAPTGETGWYMFKGSAFKANDETTKTTANLQIPGAAENSDALNGFTLFNNSIVLVPGQGKAFISGWTGVYNNPTSLNGGAGDRHSATAPIITDSSTNQNKVGDFVDSGTTDNLSYVLNDQGYGIAYGRKARDESGFGTSIYAVDKNLKILTGTKQDTTNEDVPIAVYSPANKSFYVIGVKVGSDPWQLSVQKVTSDGSSVQYADLPILLDNLGGRFTFYKATIDNNNNLFVMHPGSSATDIEIETYNLSSKVKGDTYHYDVKKNNNSNGFKPMDMYADDNGNIYATASTDTGLIFFKRENDKWPDANVALKPITPYGQGSSMYGTSDGGTIFVAEPEPESTHGAVMMYTSYDGGTTFSKEKIGVWKAAISSMNLKVDQTTATAHLLMHMESSVSCNQQVEGQSLCGIERRDFYTSAKVSIKPIVKKVTDITCDTVEKIRYMPTEKELADTTLFSPFSIQKDGTPITVALTSKTNTLPANSTVQKGDLNFGGSFSIKEFTAPQNTEYNVEVWMTAWSRCPLDDVIGPNGNVIEEGARTYINNYAKDNNTTYQAVIKDPKTLHDVLLAFHKDRFAAHKEDYVIHPALGLPVPETTLRNAGLSLNDDTTLKNAALKELARTGLANTNAADTLSFANLLGLASSTIPTGDLELKFTKFSVTGLTDTPHILNSGNVTISATTRSIISQQNHDANIASDSTAIDRLYNTATNQAEIHTNSMPNIQPQVAETASYALIPFRIVSSDKFTIPLNDIEGFATAGAAQDYYNSLTIQERKLYPKGWTSLMGSGPVVNWVNQEFGTSTSDACASQKFSSGTRCSALDSIQKDLAMNNDDLSFVFNNIGIPKSGVKYLKDQANKFNVGSLEADVNVFSKANSYKFKIEYTPDISVNCSIANLCQNNISKSVINAVGECDACKDLTGGIKDVTGAIGARLSTNVTTDDPKVPVVKDLYNYAKQTSVYNGKTISLDRSINVYGFSNYTSLYNSFPYINIEKSIDPLPFITEVGRAFNSNGSDYKPYINPLANYGNLIEGSQLFGNKSYGIMPLKDSRTSGTPSEDLLTAYQINGTNVNDSTLKAVSLNDVMRDKGKLTGYEFLKDPTKAIDIESAPQMAITSVQGNISCDLSENFHALIPTKKDSVPFVKLPSYSLYLSWTNQYISFNTVTSQDQCSNVVKNDFSNLNQWKIPALLPLATKMVTSKDPLLNSPSDYPRIAFLNSTPNGISTYISRAETKTEFTYFYDFSKKNWVQIIRADQLVDSSAVAGTTYMNLDTAKDFGINPMTASFESSMTRDGKLTIVVASPEGKIGIYKWDLMGVKEGEVSNITKTPTGDGKAFSFNNFINIKYTKIPDSIKVTNVDVNPANPNEMAFAVDATYLYKDTNALVQHNFDKHYPLIFYTDGFDFSVFDYNPLKLTKLYEDNTKYFDDNGVQTAPLDVKDMKFASDGYLDVAIQMTLNAGEITKPFRSASAMVLPCDTSDTPTKYSVYFDAQTGVLDCTRKSNLIVAKDDDFGYYLTIGDNTFDKNFGRQTGYLTIKNLYSGYKDGQQTAGNNTGTNNGSDQRPSDDYAEMFWGVPNNIMLADNDMFANDYKDDALIQRLTDYVAKRRNVSRAQTESDIRTVCQAASTRKVSCTLMIAIWGKETTWSANTGYDDTPFNCLLRLPDGSIDPAVKGLLGNATCSVNTVANWYKKFNEGLRTQTGTQTHQTIRFDNAFDLVFSYWIPFDIRLYDTNSPGTWNQCNQGVVWRADQDAAHGCSGDTQIAGTTIWPKAPATDSLINLRDMIYGDGPLLAKTTQRNGIVLPLSALDNADVASVLDPRIILTKKIYNGTGSSTGNGTTTGSTGNGTASTNHVNTSSDPYLTSQGDKCEAARSLSKTTTLAGVPTIDFRDTMKSCLGDTSMNKDLNGGKPTYIIMHDSVSPTQLDYVNLSETHKYTYNVITKLLIVQYSNDGGQTYITKTFDPISELDAFKSLSSQVNNVFQWNEPTYHAYIRSDGSIQWGQDWTKQSVHANGSCGGVSCNNVAVGISLEGSFDQPPNSASMKSAIALVKYLQGQYGIPTDHVMGHCEVQPKEKNDTVYSDITPSGVSKSDPIAYCIASSKIFRDQYLK